MQRQICPLTAIQVSTLALKLNFRDGLNVQLKCQSAYTYYFLQGVNKECKIVGIFCRLEKPVSASVIGRLPIFFHDQTIFIEDCELYTIGHSLNLTIQKALVNTIHHLSHLVEARGDTMPRIYECR